MLPSSRRGISCQEVGRAEEGVATGHRAAAGPAGHGACAEHRGPPQSPAWSSRGPRLGLSLPRVTGAGSWGSAGAAAPSSAPWVGKLGLRGAPVAVGQARRTKLPPPHTVPTTSPRTGGHPPGTRPGKWGRQAGWHRGSRSEVPKPVPAYLHGQKEILAYQNNLASHSEPRLLQEALHPPWSACTASAPEADCEASAPSPLPRDPGWGLALVDKTMEGSRRLLGRGPRWPHLSPGYSAPPSAAPGYATSSRLVGSGGQSHNLQASGCKRIAVSCETPDGTLRSSGRPPGSQPCPVRPAGAEHLGGAHGHLQPPGQQSCWKTTARLSPWAAPAAGNHHRTLSRRWMTRTGLGSALQMGAWATVSITAWLADTGPSRWPRAQTDPRQSTGQAPRTRQTLTAHLAGPDPHPPGDSHARGRGWGVVADGPWPGFIARPSRSI